MNSLSFFSRRTLKHTAGQVLVTITLTTIGHIAQSEQVITENAARNMTWATPVDTEHNLYRITSNFYRSEQIDKDMIGILQKLGIKTVINLRTHNEDSKVLDQSGIHGINIPMNTWNIEDEDVIAALRAIHQAESQGAVLLHCKHGSDRTGVVSAMYRIVYQGWSREQAIEELRKGGYGFHRIWFNIPRYLEKVDLEKIKKGMEQPEAIPQTFLFFK